MKLWYRGKELLINKVLDSTHQEYIQEISEIITTVVDSVKLCASKPSFERSQGQRKKSFRGGKKGCY